jgi:hypothetical protein
MSAQQTNQQRMPDRGDASYQGTGYLNEATFDAAMWLTSEKDAHAAAFGVALDTQSYFGDNLAAWATSTGNVIRELVCDTRPDLAFQVIDWTDIAVLYCDVALRGCDLP